MADFLVFYGIEIDPEVGYYGDLTASRFFRLAHRLGGYQGVIFTLQQNEQMKEQTQSQPATGSTMQQLSTVERTYTVESGSGGFKDWMARTQ